MNHDKSRVAIVDLVSHVLGVQVMDSMVVDRSERHFSVAVLDNDEVARRAQ